MINAIIFDFDGVIADTEPLHYRAAAAVLAARDIHVSETDFYERLMGLSDEAFFRQVLHEAGRPVTGRVLHDLLVEKNNRYEAGMFGELRPLPGVPEFVAAAARRGPTAVCSGARRFEIEALLSHFQLRPFIHTIVSIDEARVSKPDPTGYRMTLRSLRNSHPNLAPGECLVIEDSLHGIAAARAAEMRVLAVQTHYDASQLSSAHACVANLESLSPDDAAGLVMSGFRVE